MLLSVSSWYLLCAVYCISFYGIHKQHPACRYHCIIPHRMGKEQRKNRSASNKIPPPLPTHKMIRHSQIKSLPKNTIFATQPNRLVYMADGFLVNCLSCTQPPSLLHSPLIHYMGSASSWRWIRPLTTEWYVGAEKYLSIGEGGCGGGLRIATRNIKFKGFISCIRIWAEYKKLLHFCRSFTSWSSLSYRVLWKVLPEPLQIRRAKALYIRLCAYLIRDSLRLFSKLFPSIFRLKKLNQRGHRK